MLHCNTIPIIGTRFRLSTLFCCAAQEILRGQVFVEEQCLMFQIYFLTSILRRNAPTAVEGRKERNPGGLHQS